MTWKNLGLHLTGKDAQQGDDYYAQHNVLSRLDGLYRKIVDNLRVLKTRADDLLKIAENSRSIGEDKVLDWLARDQN